MNEHLPNPAGMHSATAVRPQWISSAPCDKVSGSVSDPTPRDKLLQGLVDAVTRGNYSRVCPDVHLLAAFAEQRLRGRGSRLSTFDGTGSLFAWLAVIALRDRRRQQMPCDLPTLVHDPEAPIVTDGARPELLAEFADPMRIAWGRLSARHRTVLVLRYGREVPGVRVAELLGVGPPRISCMLTKAVEELRETVAAFVGEGGAELLAH